MLILDTSLKHIQNNTFKEKKMTYSRTVLWISMLKNLKKISSEAVNRQLFKVLGFTFPFSKLEQSANCVSALGELKMKETKAK